MGRGKFSENDIYLLQNNPFVDDVNEVRIIYSDEFKTFFMQKYKRGEKPTEIFKKAGFDPKILGSKRIERAAARWRESYEAGFLR